MLFIVLGWGFIDPANHMPYIPANGNYTRPPGGRARLRRSAGHPGRGRGRLLRLHRLRRGLDRGAGGEASPARHADRHPGLAGDLHGALHPVRARADRRRQRRGVPHAGQGGVGRLRDQTYMHGYDWLAKFVTVAILAGFSSVILVMLLGQSRVFYSMSHDGLVPKVFSEVHPKFRTPWKSNLIFFVFVGAFAAFVPERHRRRHDEHRHAVRVHPRVRRASGSCAAGAPSCRARSARRWCRWSRSWGSSSARP